MALSFVRNKNLLCGSLNATFGMPIKRTYTGLFQDVCESVFDVGCDGILGRLDLTKNVANVCGFL